MDYSYKNLTSRLLDVRKSNNLTQEELGKLLGYTRAVVAQIENGGVKPSVEFIVVFCQKFNISIDSLLLDESYAKVPEGILKSKPNTKPNTKPNYKTEGKSDTLAVVSDVQYSYGTGQMPIIVTVDEAGEDNIVMVDAKAAAGYPKMAPEPTFIKQLPAFKLPGVAYKNGIFRAFQVDGDSMYDTLDHGDWVICRYIDRLSDIREGYVHVLVTKEEICVKRLLNRVNERGKIVLISDNEDYPTREVDADEVSEIWLVKAKIGFQLRPRRRDLFRIINDLQADMVEIKARIAKLELKSK